MIDDVLLRFLAIDIIVALAEDQLPAPPRVPSFAKDTVRPAKRAT